MALEQSSPAIAIVGAGPGGLTLARILQTRNIPFTIYERDSSSAARSQGGTLDLHQGSGQQALEMAGLTAEFKRFARNEGQDTRIVGKDAIVRLNEVHDDPADAARPEIDRADLRKILLESIDPSRIKWGCALSAVKPVPGTLQHTLEFKDGSSATADLVVGADGAWSCVRPLVSPHKPAYTGLTFVELHLTEVSKKHPEIAALVGRGTLLALGDNRGLIAQTNSRDNIRVYVALRCSESWAAENLTFEGMTPAEEQAAVLRHFEGGWQESLTRMVTDADPGFVTRPLFALPDAHTWAHVPGVTLLGDAAHLMLPNGEGVNLAMVDAMELALAIAAHPTADIDAAVKQYEAAMFPRSEASAAERPRVMDILIAEDGLEGALAFFASHGLPPPPE